MPPKNIAEAPELSMTVPRTLLRMWIETRAGNVQASDLDGELEARSAGGQITVEGIKGRAQLRTGGGDIVVGTIGGPGEGYSGPGVIFRQSPGGGSWVVAAGGRQFVEPG